MLLVGSITAHASEYKDRWSDGSAITLFDNDPDWKYAEARIEQEKKGKYVSFFLEPLNLEEKCKLRLAEEGESKRQIFKVNGQAIQGKVACKQWVNTGGRYYIFYAVTDAGDNFIANEFKKSREVRIEHVLQNFTLSAEGFTVEWNAQSERAL